MPCSEAIKIFPTSQVGPLFQSIPCVGGGGCHIMVRTLLFKEQGVGGQGMEDLTFVEGFRNPSLLSQNSKNYYIPATKFTS